MLKVIKSCDVSTFEDCLCVGTEAASALMNWYEKLQEHPWDLILIDMDAVDACWDFYYNAEEIRSSFQFTNNESIEEMIDFIGGYEYEVIDAGYGQYWIGRVSEIEQTYLFA